MTSKQVDYTALSNELDQIILDLQEANLDVDKAVALYERGIAITKELETYLQTAENKVKKIKADFNKP